MVQSNFIPFLHAVMLGLFSWAIKQLVANKLDCIIGYGYIYALAIGNFKNQLRLLIMMQECVF
jgi:hypothetical protein